MTLDKEIEKMFADKNFTDVVGNLPMNQLQTELKNLYGFRPGIKECILYIHDDKVNVYIPIKDFYNTDKK